MDTSLALSLSRPPTRKRRSFSLAFALAHSHVESVAGCLSFSLVVSLSRAGVVFLSLALPPSLTFFFLWLSYPPFLALHRAHSGLLFFFFNTLEPSVERYKSLWAFNTSPPRNHSGLRHSISIARRGSSPASLSMLELSRWVCGTTLSTSCGGGGRSHQIVETKSTEIELGVANPSPPPRTPP